MKRLLFLLTACTVALCASASNKYVKPDGDDSLDGKSWENALATIQTAVWGVPAGDTVFIAEGEYNQAFSVSDGQTILGGFNPATGERDIELYETIIDGKDLGKWIIVKYDAPPTSLITIDGLTMQNAEHSSEGGAIFMRGNMILSNCKIINCHGSNGGGIHLEQGAATVQGVVRNCIIELCSATSSGGAIRNKGGLIENCIIRGCEGKYGAIRNDAGTVRNCVLHNNSASVSGWPNSGGIYNPGGVVINCTLCNNWGSQYAGIHSDGDVFNTVCWGNKPEDGFGEPVNYIAGSNSACNVADQGFGHDAGFLTKELNADNSAADGPNFRNPTTFVGAPTNAGQIAAMRNADFSISDLSVALLDKGNAEHAPETDLEGVARPKSAGIDIGAYEFDPNAEIVPVTGINILQDTLWVIKEESAVLNIAIEPVRATNKRVEWTIDNEAIATIRNGAVTGVEEGNTVARVKTLDGGFTDTAIVVILPIPPKFYPAEVLAADSLYKIEDYTIPSFIPFLVAKEAARIDSAAATAEEIASIAGKIQEMNAAIAKLVNKEEPYNMVANINGDPATNMAFCWLTNEGINQGKVQILPKKNATADDFASTDGVLTIEAKATTTPALHYAVSTSGILKAAKLSNKTAFKYESHKAKAENLTPGTDYSWRVGYEGHWSPIAQFRTKDAEQGEFSFIYMTDSHIQDAEYVENAKWCATAAAKAVPEARFCLFPGDFVETGTEQNSEWEWERWFEESIKPVIMQMPIVPTDGNHDDSPLLNYDYHFNTDTGFYSMVQSAKPQFHGTTYSFVYGDVLFLVYSLQDWWRSSSGETSMKSPYLSVDVKNWFKQEVAKHPNTKYRVTLAHKNIFSGSGHSVDAEIPMFRQIMLPILKECEIDLAIQGHDHCYEVIGPIDWDTQKVVEGAVTNVKDTTVNTEKNMTGKYGGEFTTDDGTMYFIGATCGRKRYYPYSRKEMEEKYTTDPALLFDGNHHNVENYFDLFTGMFGQPKAPSFTKFTVKDDCIELNSYTADQNGNATLFNTMRVKRTKEHTAIEGYETVPSDNNLRNGEKFIRNGQLYIRQNGKTYSVIGQEVK